MENYWPTIYNLETAMAAARRAAGIGLVLAGLTLLGLILVLAGNSEAMLGEEVLPEEMTFVLIGVGIQLALVLIFSWRVSTGKGYISAILLFLIQALEVANKVIMGTGVAWIVFHGFLLLGLVQGIRATLSYKKYKKLDSAASEFE